MVYITGDTHRQKGLQKIIDFCRNNKVSRSDMLIICGDVGVKGLDDELVYRFGGIWPGIVSFIDGNHENFDFLGGLSVSEWNGGKVQKISDTLIHLMRGQVFEIGGRKIFTMGGNETRDKDRCINGIGWWPQERISKEDITEGARNLARHNNKVDIIITHCASERVLNELHAETGRKRFSVNAESRELSRLLAHTQYECWYSGHYHTDKQIGKTTCIFNDIIGVYVNE